MSNICHIAFESLVTDVAKENLFLLTFLIRFDSPHVFLDIKAVLPANEHTFLLGALRRCFFLVLTLCSLLNFEFLTAEFIVFSGYRALYLCWLTHLLYTAIITALYS